VKKPVEELYLLLAVVALFLATCATELFSDGMFVDGLFYAVVAKNMAAGVGSFWQPQFSPTLHEVFYGHPPMAFALQSLFFRLFGDHMLVERCYSLLTILLTGGLTVLIWKQLTQSFRNAWWPLLLYFSTGWLAWATANNLLENTMSVFVCLSVYLYLNGHAGGRWYWTILSGLALALGVLTKGLVCLYVWTVPFFFWLFLRRIAFGRVLRDSFLLLGSTVLPFLLLYGFIPDARTYMQAYFDQQIVTSISQVQTVSTRFYILFEYLHIVSYPIAVVVFFVLLARGLKLKVEAARKNSRFFWFFSAITACGVLPMMISLKQSGFYILTVHPLFALGLALAFLPFIEALRDRLLRSRKQQNGLKIIAFSMLLVATTIAVFQKDRIGRDKELVLASREIISRVGAGRQLGICPEMFEMWSLHGYLARYGNVGLAADSSAVHNYYLTYRDCEPPIREQYLPIDWQHPEFKLYKRVSVGD